MAARLTDRQKKRIVADYIELGSYNAVSKIHGISATTVKKVVLSSGDCVRMCEQKKEQNTADMIAFMETRKEKMQEAIDLHLKALSDPEKIESAGLSQIATSFGIIVDKATRHTAGENGGGDKAVVIIDV